MDIIQVCINVFPLFVICEFRVGGSEKLQFAGEKSQRVSQLMRKPGKQDLKLFCLYRKMCIRDREDAVGVVEIILILVVLISLVIIFKEQLTNLVKAILSKITKQSNSI